MAKPKPPKEEAPDKKNAEQEGAVSQGKGSSTAKPVGEPPPCSMKREIPVVGIGASAGGLEALKSFFSAVPVPCGMAFVVVVHLAPKQGSLLPELLQKVTKLEVKAATDGDKIQPDRVYITSPSKELGITGETIQVFDLIKTNTSSLPIDFFLQSLACAKKEKAAAVILSGTGTDGTLGLEQIKANEGLAVAQDPQTAKYNGMPHHAIQTGLVDMTLPPEAMPEKILRYFRQTDHLLGRKEMIIQPLSEDWLKKIFIILSNRTGHDFSKYKKNTMVRRVARRMGIQQIGEYDQYIQLLRESGAEVTALFRELLIGVTSFFRDHEAFATLKHDVLPGLLRELDEDGTFRVWVPGCSTGEEAYSIAMVVLEAIQEQGRQIRLQVFGTDIDETAVEKAREGSYPRNIAAEVNQERLKHFFSGEGETYRVKRELRDHIVFSVQDVLKDPPFSKLDLLSCRNLLIYLDSEAQKTLLPLFHYTLKPGGVLLLGSSETIGTFGNLFLPLDNKWKVFRRRDLPTSERPEVKFPTGAGYHEEREIGLPMSVESEIGDKDLASLSRKLILDEFAPPCIIVTPNGLIQHIQGRTGKYLEYPSGPPTQNILDLAREGLRVELAAALRKAAVTNETVERRHLRVQSNGGTSLLNLLVKPVRFPEEPASCLAVVFKEAETENSPLTALGSGESEGNGDPDDERVRELQRELQATRESHQTTIEELETSNEELKSINEELQSSNEELQSTNEELESSKEELQSLNEELQTVNTELHGKIDELDSSQDDMRNLLNSTDIATVFLDPDLRVKRFTEQATRIVNLIQTDIGRPLEHMVTKLKYEGLMEDLRQVLDTLIPKEDEVLTKDGDWYLMRIKPYRKMDNQIDGVVLTFVDIDKLKKSEGLGLATNSELAHARKFFAGILDTLPEPIMIVDSALNVVNVNQTYCRIFGCDSGNVEKSALYEACPGIWNFEPLKKNVDMVLRSSNGPLQTHFKVHLQGFGDRDIVLRKIELDGEERRPQTEYLVVSIRDPIHTGLDQKDRVS